MITVDLKDNTGTSLQLGDRVRVVLELDYEAYPDAPLYDPRMEIDYIEGPIEWNRDTFVVMGIRRELHRASTGLTDGIYFYKI